jgi:hypothetical protein
VAADGLATVDRDRADPERRLGADYLVGSRVQQVGEASDPRPDAELDRLTKHAEVGRAKPWPARAGARSSSGASVERLKLGDARSRARKQQQAAHAEMTAAIRLFARCALSTYRRANDLRGPRWLRRVNASRCRTGASTSCGAQPPRRTASRSRWSSYCRRDAYPAAPHPSSAGGGMRSCGGMLRPGGGGRLVHARAWRVSLGADRCPSHVQESLWWGGPRAQLAPAGHALRGLHRAHLQHASGCRRQAKARSTRRSLSIDGHARVRRHARPRAKAGAGSDAGSRAHCAIAPHSGPMNPTGPSVGRI